MILIPNSVFIMISNEAFVVEFTMLNVPKVADRTRNLGVRNLPAVRESKRRIAAMQVVIMTMDMRQRRRLLRRASFATKDRS